MFKKKKVVTGMRPQGTGNWLPVAKRILFFFGYTKVYGQNVHFFDEWSEAMMSITESEKAFVKGMEAF